MLRSHFHSTVWNTRGLVLGMAALGLCTASLGQLDMHDHANKANWKLANRFTAESLRPYLYSSSINPGWINDTDRFWYVWRDSSGNRYWLVDPKAKTKKPLFDSAKMAALLTTANFRPIDATTLDVGAITFDPKDENIIRFTVDRVRYIYRLKEETLEKDAATPPAEGAQTPPAGGGRGGGGNRGGFAGGAQAGARADFRNYSPDRKAYVYAQDHNLFYVEVVDDKPQEPVQLTKDGETEYSFGSIEDRNRAREDQITLLGRDFQAQTQAQTTSTETRVRANVTWSKDSKRFYVSRGDSRKVQDLFLVNSLSEPRPRLLTYKYAMPGDQFVAQSELYAFNRDKKEFTKLNIDRYKDQRVFDLHFQDDASGKLRLVRRDRLQRNLEFIEIDLDTQSVKVLLTEKTENAFLETNPVRYIKPGGDFLWLSERTGWAHFYRYSNDGKLQNAVTSGPWRCDSITSVDDKTGVLLLSGNGREPGENPYFRHLYRTDVTGKPVRLLNDGNADHTTAVSPTKDFFVDTYSRIDLPTKIALRDSEGKVVMDLEEMDLSRLTEAGFRMPESFVVKAADGVNDIYGNLWKPSDFNAHKRYPIIAYVYPCPQTESVSSTFSATVSMQRLAQLGFIVIQIGNRGGNPARSNAYHSYGYYNLRDYGLADKKYGIEQLANRFPWIDAERVGIYGHSGGGFMTGAALLLPPYNEFFKVGVSSAGNHDNNIYNQNWSEQHHGLREVAVQQQGQATGQDRGAGRTGGDDPVVEGGDGLGIDWLDGELTPQFDSGAQRETKFEIKVPANHELAANLKGHLLLVHGDMDNNVHPGGTVRLINALIRANKRFDYMVMPGKQHGFADMQGYFEQMTMEYFAEHLLGDYYRGSGDMSSKGKGR